MLLINLRYCVVGLTRLYRKKTFLRKKMWLTGHLF